MFLGCRHAHLVAFEKSDLLFVCMLKPLSYEITIDEKEIQAAKVLQVYRGIHTYVNRSSFSLFFLCCGWWLVLCSAVFSGCLSMKCWNYHFTEKITCPKGLLRSAWLHMKEITVDSLPISWPQKLMETCPTCITTMKRAQFRLTPHCPHQDTWGSFGSNFWTCFSL